METFRRFISTIKVEKWDYTLRLYSPALLYMASFSSFQGDAEQLPPLRLRDHNSTHNTSIV